MTAKMKIVGGMLVAFFLGALFGAAFVELIDTAPSRKSTEREDVLRAQNLVNETWTHIAEIVGSPADKSREEMLAFGNRFRQGLKDGRLCRNANFHELDTRSALATATFFDSSPDPGESQTLWWGITLAWPDINLNSAEAGVRFLWKASYSAPPEFVAEFRHFTRKDSDPTRRVTLLHPDGRWSYDGKRFFDSLEELPNSPLWHKALDLLSHLTVEDVIRKCDPMIDRPHNGSGDQL